MPLRRALLAAAAGLALADAAIVTLALPELLLELSTTVEGVAAVIAVYTATLALAPIPLARHAHRVGGARGLAAGGFALFTLASLACATADSLTALLVARGLQGLGGAAGMVGAFPLMRGGEPEGRRAWVAAAVLATAAGPALGGALTEAFDWRAIFIAQAPLAAAAAVVAARGGATRVPFAAGRFGWRPALGLALVSAALTAVVFLLVLELVAGFATDPLLAAALVTVTPLAALAGSRIGGDHRVRAAAGAVLVAGGTLALAELPPDRLAYTVVPQALAGLGMGLALTALAGPLLPERTAGDAARLLALRHLGITAVILALAPLLADDYDRATERAQLQGVAVVLDADLPPAEKLALAPRLLAAVDTDRPRAGLLEAEVDPEAQPVVDRVDEVLVAAVGDAFETAFRITGGLALLAALVLVPLGARRAALGALAVALVAAVATPLVYARERDRLAPAPVVLADPCEPRDTPRGEGLTGALQTQALQMLDRAACDAGATREELVLAVLDPAYRRTYERRHGPIPPLLEILRGLLG